MKSQKKKAKQALCTKLIRKFKMLDQYRGAGASERLDIGTHTMEVAEVSKRMILHLLRCLIAIAATF